MIEETSINNEKLIYMSDKLDEINKNINDQIKLSKYLKIEIEMIIKKRYEEKEALKRK